MKGEGGDTIEGIEKVDDYTIRYTLDSPDAAFGNNFIPSYASYVIPKHIIETLDREEVLLGTAEYWTTAPIGIGPYKFVQYATDQFIEYERFDDYWDAKPGPDKLFMKIASPEVAIVMLQKGEVDFVNPLQLTEVSRLMEDPNVEVIEAQNNASWYGLEHNSYTMDGFWTNPKALQAFLYSIDRQAYVDSILQGYGVVRHSWFDGTVYECPTLVEYNYDPEKAEELWNEIGLDREARGEITIDLMSWLGIKARMDYLPIAQEYLRQMGFKVNVDIIDNALINDYRATGEGPRGRDWDFHVLLTGPQADPGTILPFIDPDSGSNFGYRGWPFDTDPASGVKEGAWIYNNERIAELVPMAISESDPQKRIEIYQEIDCIWNQEFPAMSTASPSYMVAKTKRLQGVDWPTNAGLGAWTSMYKVGDWWLWEQ
jgi:ABC-type transport system substrate-binding protein